MHFRCVIDCCWLHAVRFGLGSTHDAFKFCMSHAHAFFIHTFLFFPIMVIDVFCSLSLSLSPSRINCIMAPKACKSTLVGILFKVPGHLLPLILLSPSMFGSVIRRPRSTSWRTSRKVAFIRNAKLSCQILLTLLSPLSFGLRARNLFLRDLWGVQSCLYRSFTAIYTTSISLYLSLLLHSKVYVS